MKLLEILKLFPIEQRVLIYEWSAGKLPFKVYEGKVYNLAFKLYHNEMHKEYDKYAVLTVSSQNEDNCITIKINQGEN